MQRIFATLLVVSTLLVSCSSRSTQRDKNNATDSLPSGNSATSAADTGYIKFEKDSVVLAPFEIRVNLSAKAAERIKTGRETIIIFVSLEGEPKDSAHAKFEEDGSFFVASARNEIQYGQTAHFDHIKFSRELYDQLADKDPQLSVNVYSGRKSSKDNLLDCDGIFGKTSDIAGKSFTVKGKLIYGDN